MIRRDEGYGEGAGKMEHASETNGRDADTSVMLANKRLKATHAAYPPSSHQLHASSAKVRTTDLRSLARARRLTTGCPLLDETLQGGLRTGCIHEIVGESNCGKTQLCLQLLLTSQWKKENGKIARERERRRRRRRRRSFGEWRFSIEGQVLTL